MVRRGTRDGPVARIAVLIRDRAVPGGMHEDILDAQRDLVERIEDAGWDVTEAELSVYESPWEESDDPEATVTLTARKPFPDDDDDGSPFRVQ